ncbi:MAG TPA: lysophospholipid acyltransferase family protein [bacterium]|nr:lysophospholipid acyltransferase family protein [bacterium]
MTSARSTWRNRVEAAAVRLLGSTLVWVPPPWASALGAAFGLLLHSLGILVPLTRRNVATAFADTLSPDQQRRVVRNCYVHYGRLLLEFFTMRRVMAGREPRYFELQGGPVLDAALTQGKGVVLVTAHFGNWELLGITLTGHGYPLHPYAGEQHNLLADQAINELRERAGLSVIRRKGGMRAMLKLLHARHIVGIIADQHESTRRHFVSYFGQPVSVVDGPFLLARRTGAPVVFAACIRTRGMRYRTIVEALDLPPATDDEELDLLRFTQACFARLELHVRQHPEQYFWLHRRFRLIPHDVRLTDLNQEFLRQGGMPQEKMTPIPPP